MGPLYCIGGSEGSSPATRPPQLTLSTTESGHIDLNNPGWSLLFTLYITTDYKVATQGTFIIKYQESIMRFVMVVWFIMFIVVTIVNCYNTQLELSLYIKG